MSTPTYVRIIKRDDGKFIVTETDNPFIRYGKPMDTFDEAMEFINDGTGTLVIKM